MPYQLSKCGWGAPADSTLICSNNNTAFPVGYKHKDCFVFLKTAIINCTRFFSVCTEQDRSLWILRFGCVSYNHTTLQNLRQLWFVFCSKFGTTFPGDLTHSHDLDISIWDFGSVQKKKVFPFTLQPHPQDQQDQKLLCPSSHQTVQLCSWGEEQN